MKVALVHDWLVAHRGGEMVLEALCRRFPDAPIYTLVHAPGRISPIIARHRIITSFIQGLPGSPLGFRKYLPLFPRAVESWDLSGYDLVISTSHCVAKGVRSGSHQKHLSYVHTPMRYIWDQLDAYLPAHPLASGLRVLAAPLVAGLRRWDRRSAKRPDVLLANSSYVAERIYRVWGRRADLLHPPVDIEFFRGAGALEPREGYLVVSALVPYKRVDLAISAANRLGAGLTVVGTGSQLERLRRLAGPTVTFVGQQPPAALRALYAKSRALLHCGVEDFGIVAVEAMAAGCPVIARREGGMKDSVGDPQIVQEAGGVLFDDPTPEAVVAAVAELEAGYLAGRFTREALGARAELFSPRRFMDGMLRHIAALEQTAGLEQAATLC